MNDNVSNQICSYETVFQTCIFTKYEGHKNKPKKVKMANVNPLRQKMRNKRDKRDAMGGKWDLEEKQKDRTEASGSPTARNQTTQMTSGTLV